MTNPQVDAPKKWYKKWWGITLIVLGGLALIGSIVPSDDTSSNTPDYTSSNTSSDWGDSPTTTAAAPTTTWSPPSTTQGLSDKRLAFLAVIAMVPAYEDAGATEDQIWEQLRIVCDGFDGGLDYLEIGTIMVNAADGAGISPFGYEEAGAVVGTATTVVCPEYDGWQN